MAKLIYAPEAKMEIKEVAVYYECCKKSLGQAFLEAFTTNPLEESQRFLEKFPQNAIWNCNSTRLD